MVILNIQTKTDKNMLDEIFFESQKNDRIVFYMCKMGNPKCEMHVEDVKFKQARKLSEISDNGKCKRNSKARSDNGRYFFQKLTMIISFYFMCYIPSKIWAIMAFHNFPSFLDLNNDCLFIIIHSSRFAIHSNLLEWWLTVSVLH